MHVDGVLMYVDAQLLTLFCMAIASKNACQLIMLCLQAIGFPKEVTHK